MTTPKEIGKAFTEARKKLKLSVEEAYRQTRIHPGVIRDIENGVFDRLGKPYIKGFLKKYSAFLGLDTMDIIQKYESISPRIAGRELDLTPEEKGVDTPVVLTGMLTGKRLQAVFAVALSAVFVILVFVLIGMLKSRMTAGRRQKVTEISKTQRTVVTTKRDIRPVTLTLKARAKVWLQVTEGEDTLFAGILAKGHSKTWISDRTLTVWVGKADMLDFFVNRRKIGVIAAGVVKDIRVSSGGIRIGDVWVTHLE